MTATTRFLDLADPGFDVTSDAVHDARDDNWFAETPYGWAILRYEEGPAILQDRRFRQGNDKWPDQNGIHDGPWREWWQETLLSIDGDDHLRLRRLSRSASTCAATSPASRPRSKGSPTTSSASSSSGRRSRATTW